MKSEILILDKLPHMRDFLLSDGLNEPRINIQLEALRDAYVTLGLEYQFNTDGNSEDAEEKYANLKKVFFSIGYLYDDLRSIQEEMKALLSE